jgi:prevent-host-death family protein
MTEKVSTMEVRARIGDMLNRVALRHDEFIIARKGKPLAALVPIERLEQMRRFSRLHGLAYQTAQLAAGQGEELSEDEAMKIALDAQRVARRKLRTEAEGQETKRKR